MNKHWAGQDQRDTEFGLFRDFTPKLIFSNKVITEKRTFANLYINQTRDHKKIY